MRVLYITPAAYLTPYYDDVADALDEHVSLALYDFDQPAEPQLEGVSVVIEHGGQFSTPAMWDAGRAAGVRLWQVTATGLDHMNVAAFLERGIPLANMPGLSSTAIPMAEHVFALMLAVAKRLQQSRERLQGCVLFEPMTSELHGKTLGLIGVGASGREVARRAAAFGMRVVAVDAVEPPPDVQSELRIEFLGGADALGRLLPLADYVSLQVPLTSATRDLLNRSGSA
jgi:phosphoglycerate dehydrogenase-like enzyme